MKKRFLAIFLALLCFAAPLTGLAGQSRLTRYVKTGNDGKLNVRRTMKTNTDNLVAQLENGTAVTLVSYHANDTWALIEFKQNNKTVTGYVMTRFLTASAPSKSTATPKPINFSGFKHVTPYQVLVRPATPGGFVNLRWAPGKENAVMCKLLSGAHLTVIAQNGDWAQVWDEETGYVGFIMRSFLQKLN